MQEIINFFEQIVDSESGINYLVFGDEEDLLAAIRNETSYPCLFVSGVRKTFEGDPDEQLFGIYEVQVEVLMPNEKGNYKQRLQIWKDTEILIDSLLRQAVEVFRLDWTSFRLDWLAGYTSSNLAGVSAVLPIKVPFSTCL